MCSACKEEIETWDGGFGLVAHGFGDRGLIDTFHGEIELSFCSVCARDVLSSTPWLEPAFAALNINYGHRCNDGEIHWTPMPACVLDADQHGWREVWQVRPASAVRVPDRAPVLTKSGKTASFGVFDSEAEATVVCAQLVAEGCDAKVTRSPLGNVAGHAEIVEWRAFWPEWHRENRRFLQRQRVRRAIEIPMRPVWVVRRVMRAARRAAAR